MYMIGRGLFCLFVLLYAIPLYGNNSLDIERAASARFLRAYDMMYIARTLEGQNMKEESADAYTSALRELREIKKDFAGWRTGPVDERIGYCTNRIALLTGHAPAPVATVQNPPLPVHADEVGSTRGAAGISDSEAMVLDPIVGDIELAAEMEMLGDYEAAFEMYDEVISSSPDNIPACKGLARCYMSMGMAKEAAELLERAFYLNRTDPELRVLLASAYCGRGRYDEARSLVVALRGTGDLDATGYVVLGVASAGLGDTSSAAGCMRQALSIEPGLAEAHYNLAQLEIASRPPDFESAAEHYKLAVELGSEPDARLQKIFDSISARARKTRR